eukprot:CAMPEP_0179065752 /NCGR_PEP_ID=MMETSP0796-20121207/28624_1 /TAXON_ID=73915 /ORGANISM="Pyrodinium bahamense, Strain pbaha01" /LENGTH=125 /DNA_ID=CAMNT_0020762737 /DNA_START=221 /DNA_END=596 /DNA_ORIENTATION=-
MASAASIACTGRSEADEQHAQAAWEDTADGRAFKVRFDVGNVAVHEVPTRDSREYKIHQAYLAVEFSKQLASQAGDDLDVDEDDEAGLRAHDDELARQRFRAVQGVRVGLGIVAAFCTAPATECK